MECLTVDGHTMIGGFGRAVHNVGTLGIAVDGWRVKRRVDLIGKFSGVVVKSSARVDLNTCRSERRDLWADPEHQELIRKRSLTIYWIPEPPAAVSSLPFNLRPSILMV